MKMINAVYLSTLQEWRTWLKQHYENEKEAWLIFYKVGTGMPSINYDEAVEEALCYGWIDSIIQKIDEERYARKFTPRTNTAKWSVPNKRRVAKLLREGRMTAAGLAKIDDLASFQEDLEKTRPKVLELSPDLQQTLQSNPLAWENFQGMAPSYQRQYIGWITDAKRPETIKRRLNEAIQRLEQNLPLGMK